MMPPERRRARARSALLFDLDDTVLSHGVLTREAYEALWSTARSRPSARRRDRAAERLGRGHRAPVADRRRGDGERRRARRPRRQGRRRCFDGDAGRGRRAPRAARRARSRPSRRRCPTSTLADDVHARRSDVTWDIGERERLDAERRVERARARSSSRRRADHALDGAPPRDLRARRQGERRDPLRPRTLRRRRRRSARSLGVRRRQRQRRRVLRGVPHTFGVANVRAYVASSASAALGRAPSAARASRRSRGDPRVAR